MCGITAYRGTEQAAPLLLEALRTLEYRGYDSAGIAVLDDQINVKKGVGKVNDVHEAVDFSTLTGTIGISHTRWATTGAVTKENAHPHVSDDGTLAIVQNGIVENYQELKKMLQEKGYTFRSETDTEVILQCIVEEAKQHDMLTAVQRVFQQLHGRNTFVVLTKEGDLYAARKGSPLILGVAPHGMMLASDAAPLLEHTKKVVFLDDNELIHCGDAYTIYDATTLEKKEKDVTEITWTLEQAQKGNYAHFMLKEIMEQRHTIADAIAQDRRHIIAVADMINDAFGTYVVACGSAGKAALAATYIFSTIAKRHLNFALGSEFPCYHDFLTNKSLLITISQSGETADTLEAVEVVQEKKGEIVTIVNVLGSTMDRVADATIPVLAGPEKSVCSTKAITNQLAIIYMLAYACANKYDEGLVQLRKTAQAVHDMLTDAYCKEIEALAQRLEEQRSIYIIGRGVNYPMALEAAIKIQEVSYIHAEGFAAGELKHGPIALIDEGTPLIAFVPNDDTKEDTIASALEVKARGGMIIGVAPENNDAFDHWIPVPDVGETNPIVNIIPIQLLAYYLAVAKGNDVDMPRNLAKSVTVK